MVTYIILGNSGDLEEKLPIQHSSGSSDAGKLVALGSDGTFDPSVLPLSGINDDIICNLILHRDILIP